MGKRVFVTLHGQKIELRFTMCAWETIENDIAPLEELTAKMQQKGRLRLIPRVVSILAAESGMTAEQVFEAMEPADVRQCTDAIMRAITAGLRMDEKGEEGKPKDAVLEEIESKKNQAV